MSGKITSVRLVKSRCHEFIKNAANRFPDFAKIKNYLLPEKDKRGRISSLR